MTGKHAHVIFLPHPAEGLVEAGNARVERKLEGRTMGRQKSWGEKCGQIKNTMNQTLINSVMELWNLSASTANGSPARVKMRDLVLESDNQSARHRRWQHGWCRSCHEYSMTTHPVSTARGSAHALTWCGAQGCRLNHLVLEANVCVKAKGDDLYSTATPT